MLIVIISTLLLVVGLCVDTFVTSFSYGVNKIKIPGISALVINLVSTSFLALSLYFAQMIASLLTPIATMIIGFSILFIIGCLHLAESILKSYLKKHHRNKKTFNFKVFDIFFNLNLTVDDDDLYHPQTRMLKADEAAFIAIAISIDELAIGFGIGLIAVSPLYIIGAFFLCGILSVFLGSNLGRTLAYKTELNLSWITGIVLILIAFMKFF